MCYTTLLVHSTVYVQYKINAEYTNKVGSSISGL